MTDTTTPVDPELLAARTNCRPDCPGPTPAELAGLHRPHSCERTLAAQPDGQRATAEAFIAEALAGTAALAESRDLARDVAARLEQELAMVRETLGQVLHGCPDHDVPDGWLGECALCSLDAWAKGADDALNAYMASTLHLTSATRADE